MKHLRAADIQCVADEAGAKEFEFESPDCRQLVSVRSHSKDLAAAAAAEFFKSGAGGPSEHAELF